jgi:protein phosphatase
VTRLPLRDPSLVVLVGVAGSGKSTLAARLFASDEILSSDALRAEITGGEANQSADGIVFPVLHRQVAKRLGAGQLTAIDATNLRPDHRRPLIARARSANTTVAAIVLDLPLDVVLARNAARARVVPTAVIARQYTWLRDTVDQQQLDREGIDPVLILRSVGDVAALEIVRNEGVGSGGRADPTRADD